MTDKLTLTRYLYFGDEVSLSLLDCLIAKRDLNEALFWIDELYSSGFEDCVVFTQDGKGDFMSGSAWNFSKQKLSNIYYQSEENSIGQIYAEATRFLGFKPNRHEGKVTGLAATGEPNIFGKCFEKLTYLDKNFLIKRSNCLISLFIFFI